MSIATLIKTIQDIMRKDVGVDGDAQRISQIVWLLFLKIFDDKEQEWQVTIPGYKSPLQNRFRWSNWAKDAEGITGEELIEFVNNELFPSLKQLATKAGVSAHGRVVGAVFEDAYNYMKSGHLLRQVINTIEDDVDFNSSSDRHLFNDIYEKILADLQSAGNAGEYYTPRAVTQFMVDILNPQLGESVLDPACGTGGFLTCTIEHLNRQVKNNEDRNTLQACIHGVEKKPLPHMLAMTNMMLHGIDVPSNIRHDNTLSRPLKDYGPKDRVDIIITNPPFGGMEEDGIENNFPRKYQTRETADLFMALIMHLLKHDTGRAAVVLPDSFLFGEGAKTTLKRELLEEFNLHTIVRLPKGVFAPYTSIATNVLFFEKGQPTQDVWFFEHPYPDGYKSYSRSKPLTIAEFDLEKKWWGGASRKGRKATQHAWKVSAKDIAANNYNLDCKNPHEVAVNHGAPAELRAVFSGVVNRLSDVKNALKESLLEVLPGDTKAVFYENYDIAFSAPSGINRLRELILVLGMRGKLVPQYSQEPSAHQLLIEIEAEKDRVARERGGKFSRLPMDTVTAKVPYQLPESWSWVCFGEIAQHNSGKTLDKSRNTGLPRDYITTSNLYWGRFDLTNIRQMLIREEEMERCTAKKGDLLICEGGEAGRAAVWEFDEEVCFQNHVHRARFFGGIDPYFAYRFFEKLNATGEIELHRKGVGISNMSSKALASIVFPLPPVPEQHRIVSKIDQLMKLCDEIEEQLSESQRKQTELLDALMAQV